MKNLFIISAILIHSLFLFSQDQTINLTNDLFEFSFNDSRIGVMQKNADKKIEDANNNFVAYNSSFTFRNGVECPVYVMFKFENDTLKTTFIQFAINFNQERYSFLYNELDYLLGDFYLHYSHQFTKDTIHPKDAYELIKADEYWSERFHKFNSIVYSVNCKNTKSNGVIVNLYLYEDYNNKESEQRIVIFDIKEELELLKFCQSFESE